MKTAIGKWGNSLALRLPAALCREMDLSEGTVLDMTAHDGAIILRSPKAEYSLDELVRGITRKNRHDEFDWGEPMGREAW